MTDTLDPLKPIDQFRVGEWNCVIKQLVSGPLMWEATHAIKSPRAGRMPAGMDVAAVRNEVQKILAPVPPVPTTAE